MVNGSKGDRITGASFPQMADLREEARSARNINTFIERFSALAEKILGSTVSRAIFDEDIDLLADIDFLVIWWREGENDL
jgi:predicted glycosyl hydrolase (DUF1957 family)